MKADVKPIAYFVGGALAGAVLGLGDGRSPSLGSSSFAQAAVSSAVLERLTAEDDIRQRLALYALYIDGDGVHRKSIRALADTLMTPEAVTEIFPANGGPPQRFAGRDEIAAIPQPRSSNAVAGRHYIVQTSFDKVTPNTAETRSIALHFEMSRNVVGPRCVPQTQQCGGRVIQGNMWTYHMTWRKTADGWQVAYNALYVDN